MIVCPKAVVNRCDEIPGETCNRVLLEREFTQGALKSQLGLDDLLDRVEKSSPLHHICHEPSMPHPGMARAASELTSAIGTSRLGYSTSLSRRISAISAGTS